MIINIIIAAIITLVCVAVLMFIFKGIAQVIGISYMRIRRTVNDESITTD